MNTTPVTTRQLTAALALAGAVGQAIRDLREVPSGHLYATLAGRVDLQTYEQVIGLLKRADLVTETPGHLLRWIGPIESNSNPTERSPSHG